MIDLTEEEKQLLEAAIKKSTAIDAGMHVIRMRFNWIDDARLMRRLIEKYYVTFLGFDGRPGDSRYTSVYQVDATLWTFLAI